MTTGERGAVVVTGASTGIGRATAVRLDRAGFEVFAGVRKEEDAASLREESPRLRPFFVDVARGESIAAAAREIAESLGGKGLAGLVNNAGIGLSAPVEYLSLDAVRHLFEVNVFGQLAVTQAFLPHVRVARGRVVNIGSVGDRITIPFGGALCGSKSAFASFNDALRLELRPFGIHVCLIEPGSIATPAVHKTLGDSDGFVRSLPPQGRERYEQSFRTFTARALARENDGSPPAVVAEAVLVALTAARPRTRYPVGKDARVLVTLPRLFPDRLLDLLRLRIFGLPRRFGERAGE